MTVISKKLRNFAVATRQSLKENVAVSQNIQTKFLVEFCIDGRIIPLIPLSSVILSFGWPCRLPMSLSNSDR